MADGSFLPGPGKSVCLDSACVPSGAADATVNDGNSVKEERSCGEEGASCAGINGVEMDQPPCDTTESSVRDEDRAENSGGIDVIVRIDEPRAVSKGLQQVKP